MSAGDPSSPARDDRFSNPDATARRDTAVERLGQLAIEHQSGGAGRWSLTSVHLDPGADVPCRQGYPSSARSMSATAEGAPAAYHLTPAAST